jgi:predicted nucleic acid-binding Zn ribbon protein
MLPTCVRGAQSRASPLSLARSQNPPTLDHPRVKTPGSNALGTTHGSENACAVSEPGTVTSVTCQRLSGLYSASQSRTAPAKLARMTPGRSRRPTRCLNCGKPLPARVPGRAGQPRKTCSNACRQALSRNRARKQYRNTAKQTETVKPQVRTSRIRKPGKPAYKPEPDNVTLAPIQPVTVTIPSDPPETYNPYGIFAFLKNPVQESIANSSVLSSEPKQKRKQKPTAEYIPNNGMPMCTMKLSDESHACNKHYDSRFSWNNNPICASHFQRAQELKISGIKDHNPIVRPAK